jgi:putative DNA primase/helicase
MDKGLTLRDAASGRWRSILTVLGMPERALSGKHGPCPMCGGRDRFRFDDKEGRGTYFCSGCGAGDGVQLAMGITGMGFADVAREIERIVGTAPKSSPKPERTTADKVAALRRVFKESVPIERGDQACSYLAGRGLALYDLPLSIRPVHGYRAAG